MMELGDAAIGGVTDAFPRPPAVAAPSGSTRRDAMGGGNASYILGDANGLVGEGGCDDDGPVCLSVCLSVCLLGGGEVEERRGRSRQ
jgi:hypothetical protein